MSNSFKNLNWTNKFVNYSFYKKYNKILILDEFGDLNILKIYHKNMGEPQRGSSSIIMAFTEAKYHKFPRIDSSKGRTWSS